MKPIPAKISKTKTIIFFEKSTISRKIFPDTSPLAQAIFEQWCNKFFQAIDKVAHFTRNKTWLHQFFHDKGQQILKKGSSVEILGLFRYSPPSPVEVVAAATSVFTECLLRVSRQCTHFTDLKYLPRSWLLAETRLSKQTGICNNFIKQKLEPYCSAAH